MAQLAKGMLHDWCLQSMAADANVCIQCLHKQHASLLICMASMRLEGVMVSEAPLQMQQSSSARHGLATSMMLGRVECYQHATGP